MKPAARPAAFLLALALSTTGCAIGGSAASPGTPTPSPQPSPDPGTYWLRATYRQALPPLDVFGQLPMVVITGNGTVVAPAPVPAIYPGPAVVPLSGRTISEAGRLAIVNAARTLGLLGGSGDFTGGRIAPGGVTGRLELTVDGRRLTIAGNPQAPTGCTSSPCNPPAGSPAAFAELWRRLGDLQSWIGPELGNQGTYDPPTYAVLVGPAPNGDPALPQAPAIWPLPQPIALFGGPVANGQARCGLVSGTDAATFRVALQNANGLTPWHQDVSTNATFGLTVRPMVPGEDACRETFGPA